MSFHLLLKSQHVLFSLQFHSTLPRSYNVLLQSLVRDREHNRLCVLSKKLTVIFRHVTIFHEPLRSQGWRSLFRSEFYYLTAIISVGRFQIAYNLCTIKSVFHSLTSIKSLTRFMKHIFTIEIRPQLWRFNLMEVLY